MSEKAPIVAGKRLQKTQAQVNEVVDIMRINVDKVLERDKNLSELDGRADALQADASKFEASAGRLKRKFWWKNCKLLLLLGFLLLVLAIMIIVWVATEYKSNSSPPSASLNAANGSEVDSRTYSSGTSGGVRGQETVPRWSGQPPKNSEQQNQLKEPENTGISTENTAPIEAPKDLTAGQFSEIPTKTGGMSEDNINGDVEQPLIS